MHLLSYRIKNFRRLVDTHVQLADDISIFVGANNSGKTSATHILHAFLTGAKERLSIYDFSSSCWGQFDEFGNQTDDADPPPNLPTISIDLWFSVGAADLVRVIPVLPSMNWQGTEVGLRIVFAPRNPLELLSRFQQARTAAQAKAAALQQRDNEKYTPWPSTMADYLSKRLPQEYELRYFVLDRAQFDSNLSPLNDAYDPPELGVEPGGAALLRTLIKVDNLSAQRHLTDSVNSGERSEELSRRLSRFYKRNLDQFDEDHHALRALFDSELNLNDHLRTVFKSTLDRLSRLGYPGIANPRLEIRSALNPSNILSGQDTRIHYALGAGDDAVRLPDTHNGLGFKNLIYMVVEILDVHAGWIAMKDDRPPLHLIFIEEPEAHMHAQLQQVFIRNVLDLIKEDAATADLHNSQLIVTTHSPHILYERGFRPIRYFRRRADGEDLVTDVLNLSQFYNAQPDDRDFLSRYLKLTHCDLFFADAAILVEGNVERLLLPVMIEKEAPKLRSACVCILEVGGAFAHRFKSLIEFLGVSTLIITDLDSVMLPANNPAEMQQAASDDDDEEEEEVAAAPNANAKKYPPKKKACPPCTPGDVVTSNQALIKWLPKKTTIADLFNTTNEEKTFQHAQPPANKIRVAYQVCQDVTWQGATNSLCGRTLEEDFGLTNAQWCQEAEQQDLGLKLRGPIPNSVDLANRLHTKVTSKSFDKTNFALGVLSKDPASWHVPPYIRDGVKWLEEEVPLEIPADAPADAIAAEVREAVVAVATHGGSDE